MELCGNLTQSLCDYVRESQQRPFKTASDPHAANKVLLFKVVVNFHISKIFIHLDVYLYPIHWPAPSWLVSSIGRALHRYRRGHGFKSRTGLNFFQVLFTTIRFSNVLSCEDLLISWSWIVHMENYTTKMTHLHIKFARTIDKALINKNIYI